MAKLLKLRRGTTSQHGSFTGAEGEVTVDTDKETLVVHDGSTAGGHPVAAEDMANVSSASIVGRLASNSLGTAKIANDAITSAKLATDSVGTDALANNAVDTGAIAANAVTQAKIAGGAVDDGKLASNAVTTAKINADAVTGAKIADDAINSEHYVNASIDHAHLANDCVNGDNIANDSINSEHYVDASIDHAHLANDCVDGTNIQDNCINSEHYVDGSIDAVHLASNSVTVNKIGADAVNGTKIADDSINSEHYINSSIDREHLNITNTGSNGQALTRAGSQFTWTTISSDGGNAATLDSIDSSSFLRSDAADTATSDITFSGGAGAIQTAANSDIRLTSGSWTGNMSGADGKIQQHSSTLYLCGGDNGIMFREHGTDRWQIDGGGTLVPMTNNTYDIGTSSKRVRDLYTNDLNLSNEGGSNDVDGTWGSYTIQEGEDALFLINRRNGKKYQFNLTEVS